MISTARSSSLAVDQPDGQDIVVNWCRQRDADPAAGTDPPMELYQKYVGHDNNRDSYASMVESRVISARGASGTQIIYVQHQSSPFPTRIWLPPFADP